MATSTPTSPYTAAIDNLLLMSRMAAVRVMEPGGADQALDRVFFALDRAVLDRIRDSVDDVARRGTTALAGLIGGHVVVLRGSLDVDAARPVLQALWSPDLARRLEADRWMGRVCPDDPGVEEVRRLLRVDAGDHRAAAAGQLARYVTRTAGRDTEALAGAWFAVHGEDVLWMRRASEVAAVSMVRAGAQKRWVADLAGIARTTLDAWIDRQLTGRARR